MSRLAKQRRANKKKGFRAFAFGIFHIPVQRARFPCFVNKSISAINIFRRQQQITRIRRMVRQAYPFVLHSSFFESFRFFFVWFDMLLPVNNIILLQGAAR